MKKIALLVLALATIVNADEEEGVQELASLYDADVQTTKGCLNEIGKTFSEMMVDDEETWHKMINNEDDEETKKSIETHGRFIACMLEMKDMMKDSYLVLNKILQTFEKKESTLTKIASKEVITECVNTFNENVELTRETRAFGFMICISREETVNKK
ncbi:uncharacterized protein [Anoplolepis gracilipes]|uniref:uncharacterized protein isoform X2 n=1 Tax=Anoplolepis gracilipes TaxID=354296 RepID=UPI003BA088C4